LLSGVHIPLAHPPLRMTVMAQWGELLDKLVADSPQRNERALRAACNSIQARIELWNGTLSTLRAMRAA
jgi:hypothetical protein